MKALGIVVLSIISILLIGSVLFWRLIKTINFDLSLSSDDEPLMDHLSQEFIDRIFYENEQ